MSTTLSDIKQTELFKTQMTFSGYIRDPSRPLPEGIEPRRMAIYSELFFNNIESFVSSAFPVLRSLVDDEEWNQSIRHFIKHHSCKTPYFLKVAEEFLDYLTTEPDIPLRRLPFLLELAHYEWVELALLVSDEPSELQEVALGEELEATWRLSPLAWPLAYAYDVQRIGDEYCPNEPPAQPTFILANRKIDDEVGFTALNAVSYRLFQLIEENPKSTLGQLLEQVIKELGHPNPEVVFSGAISLLRDFMQKGIVGR